MIEIETTGPTLEVQSRHWRGIPGSVDYTLTVPTWMPLELSGVNTDMSVENSAAEVKVESAGGAETPEARLTVLSLARAEAVSARLQKHLANPQRVKAEGRGESNPVAPNDNKVNCALNRRVEITLLVAPENTQAEINGLPQGTGK